MSLLADLRISHQWTQREVARRINVSHMTYRRYEYGEEFPKKDALIALAKLYGMSPGDLLNTLLGWNEPAKDRNIELLSTCMLLALKWLGFNGVVKETEMNLFKMEWSKLKRQQLGRLGEYFAKLLFTSYGWYVYSTEIDDHGIDFVVKTPDDKDYYDVQVKSVTAGKDTCNMPKSKTTIDDSHLICFLRFTEGELPNAYIFKTSEWNNPRYKDILGENDYTNANTSSDPEYNIHYSKKNEALFSELVAEKFLERM